LDVLDITPSCEDFMKRGLPGLLALGLVLASISPLHAQPRGRGDAESAKYGWISDLDEGITQAAKTGKPLMVVFRCVP
jgi:hypothetical protein